MLRKLIMDEMIQPSNFADYKPLRGARAGSEVIVTGVKNIERLA